MKYHISSGRTASAKQKREEKILLISIGLNCAVLLLVLVSFKLGDFVLSVANGQTFTKPQSIDTAMSIGDSNDAGKKKQLAQSVRLQ
jgi:hypothetical protein